MIACDMQSSPSGVYQTATGGVIGPHYASSKSALHGLVHWLSLRYCKHGVVSGRMFTLSLEMAHIYADRKCYITSFD